MVCFSLLCNVLGCSDNCVGVTKTLLLTGLFTPGTDRNCTVVLLTCFDNCVGVLVICVLVLTVFCIVCTVFLYGFVYVYLILFVLPPSDNPIAVSNK